jgi:PAS domain S-box-containing protein
MRQTLDAPTRHNRQREHELIEAAIAVNEAPTLDEAFAVLAETGLALLGCDRLSVVVWDDDVSIGVVRAGAGSAVGDIGAVTPAGADSTSATAGAARYPGQELATVIRVPLVTESCRATFEAAWRSPLDEADTADAIGTLCTLTRLTTLAERTQREHEQIRFDSVIDAVADGVVVTSHGTSIANAAARAILGLRPGQEVRSELFNARFLDGTPTGASGMPGANLREGGGRFRVRATSLDGRELVIDGSVSPLPGGAVIVFRDVTEEHERAVVNEQYLRALFDSIPTAINVIHPETRESLSANRAFLDLVGLDESEVVGSRPPYPWWGDGEVIQAPGGGERHNRTFHRSDGRPVPVEIESHAILGDACEPVAYFGLITDLSERRRLEQQLAQSGKLAAIGELAAGVAHEINNPLFAILGLTEFLLKETEPGSKPYARLELIQQTGLEIKEIVRALLDFARENADERHVVALEDVVQQTVDLVRRTNAHKGVELVDTYDGSGATISASPNQVKQIFLNLVANARQAMPNGGTVRLDVRREGDDVVATVADDGPGIDLETQRRIFEPFFTTKRLTGGTGLGLSVSLGIAEAHGGSLTVESTPGDGATFTLRLPVTEKVDA